MSSLSPAAVLVDSSGNPIASTTSDPTGTERGLVVRNIPSGTQDVAASSEGTTGSAVPTTAMQVGGEDPDGNLASLQLDATGSLKTAAVAIGTGGYYPEYDDMQPGPGNHEAGQMLIDSAGNQKVRGPVLTDEGSIRDDFPGTSLDTNCTGTATFTSGSYDVLGVGTAFTTELSRYYAVRRSADNSSYAARIADIVDDTHLVLSEPYAGTTGSSTPVKSVWASLAAAGGSITVGSSILTVASGTTNGSFSYTYRLVDYGPLVCSFYASISQRISNQEVRLGLIDALSVSQQAVIVFDGTDNTKLKLRTGNSGSASDIETSAATTMPGGVTSTGYHWYRLELTAESVTVYVDGTFCVQNKIHVPNFYSVLGMITGIANTGVPASSTNLLVDTAWTSNFNLVQVGGGVLATPSSVSVGGNDAGTFRRVSAKAANEAPNSTEYGEIVRPIPIVTSTTSVAQVASANTNTVLLASNPARMGATIFNLSTQVCYVKLGTTASATSFTVRMSANSYYEVPFGYTGIISGIWAAVNGNAYVTEFTK